MSGAGARSQKCTVDGIEFDSMSEACFYCWCREAKELRVIGRFQMQPHWDLIEPAKYTTSKQLKTKVKKVERSLLQGCGYTADFIIYPRVNIPGLLNSEDPSQEINHDSYVIDVKGSFNKASSEFSLYQKIMWLVRGIYVNKVVCGRNRSECSLATYKKVFFFQNGRPARLPDECYQKSKPGQLYANWSKQFDGCPTIKEVWK